MLFNSYQFIFLFMPAVLAVYWLLRGNSRHRLAILWLAGASYVFYLSGEQAYPWLIAISIVFNYLIGVLVSRAEQPVRRLLLVFGISADLLALGYFKYLNFLGSTLLQTSGVDLHLDPVVLPIGISFFTFTQIAFLVDAYRQEAKDYSIVNYSLFVTFFPHLIAGPILHHKEMMPQFESSRRGRLAFNIMVGLTMFAIGLFKKVMIADSVAPTVTDLFSAAQHGEHLTLLHAWAAALAYAVQIYFDFSGYSDMAIGLGRMFGINLPVNFNSPYKAVSIIDFWRRWHITLSRFLRDYLYFSLGGNRLGTARRYVNLFVTMVLGGIWHGAGWTFVAWGALHGAFLVLCHLWTAVRQRLGLGALPWWAARGLTFLCVVFAFVPFRAHDLTTAVAIWKGMVGMHGLALPEWHPAITALAHWLGLPVDEIWLSWGGVGLTGLAILAAWVLPNSQQILWRVGTGLDSPGYAAVPRLTRSSLLAWRLSLVWLVATGTLLGLSLRAIRGYSEFIYFQF